MDNFIEFLDSYKERTNINYFDFVHILNASQVHYHHNLHRINPQLKPYDELDINWRTYINNNIHTDSNCSFSTSFNADTCMGESNQY